MSRQAILSSVNYYKPKPTDRVTLPELSIVDQDQLLALFQESVTVAGGESHLINSTDELTACIEKHYPNRKETYSNITDIDIDYIDAEKCENPHQLNTVDLAILKGEFGVAENGAIWITDSDINYRAICFITQQLILVIKRKDIVANMHEAYQKTSFTEAGFGCFIAGPSKTADIEQSLVIGAHGARGLTVYIID